MAPERRPAPQAAPKAAAKKPEIDGRQHDYKKGFYEQKIWPTRCKSEGWEGQLREFHWVGGERAKE
eukprot:639639-Pyramimonas_sp.AAC.1